MATEVLCLCSAGLLIPSNCPVQILTMFQHQVLSGRSENIQQSRHTSDMPSMTSVISRRYSSEAMWKSKALISDTIQRCLFQHTCLIIHKESYDTIATYLCMINVNETISSQQDLKDGSHQINSLMLLETILRPLFWFHNRCGLTHWGWDKIDAI